MRDIVRNASPLARLLMGLALVFLALTFASLVRRAIRGDSDIGVFYRAAVALANGAGGEIYRELDAPTGWYNCIPPAGMSLFIGLAYVQRVVAGVIWGIVNLGLLAACFALLRRIYTGLGEDRKHYEATLPFAFVTLAVFGGVCLQTGQTSILFVLCWLGYVLSTSMSKSSLAGFLLAVPAVIKLYPVLFGLIPLLRMRWREAAMGIAWIAVLMFVVPAVFFGENLFELTASFFQYQVLDPGGRVMTSAAPIAVSNQGIDAVMLRYLTYVPEIHDLPLAVPHANLDPSAVLAGAHALRVAIIAFTTVISIQWLRNSNGEPPFLLMALWCAALYMALPGAKGRYAIYALPAMLAMFAAAHRAFDAGLRRKGVRLTALSVTACVLLIQLVPDYLLQFGVGFLGTLILWTFTVRETMALPQLARASGENYASGGKRASDVF